ncbi:serine/threonine-protein kinase [Paenarthrobacter sp. NCHU4564]|uniref:serine/threonine-protein kinase n=1 Tax=Paenarthrobacter sp. NCHU4564 TaxID=3451353 RepID=UPI003F9CE241
MTLADPGLSEPAHRPDPESGHPVLNGRYRLGRHLGGGSEAHVHEALDLRTSNLVAVKVFRAKDPSDDAPYRRELEIHSRLKHRNVVRIRDGGRAVLDQGSGEARNFLVMELVDGQDLRSITHAGPVSSLRTAAWMTDIASALAHVHRRGVIHNDVKPGNILVDFSRTHDGEARLTDFGIALSSRHQAPGSSSGTPHYLSPEEVAGEPATAASDIYSLGLVALECLTGTKAFPGPPLESMVARTLTEPRIPGTVLRRWSMVLHAMTDPSPEARPTAREATRMLRRINR